jgi:hypothetical protein
MPFSPIFNCHGRWKKYRRGGILVVIGYKDYYFRMEILP